MRIHLVWTQLLALCRWQPSNSSSPRPQTTGLAPLFSPPDPPGSPGLPLLCLQSCGDTPLGSTITSYGGGSTGYLAPVSCDHLFQYTW